MVSAFLAYVKQGLPAQRVPDILSGTLLIFQPPFVQIDKENTPVFVETAQTKMQFIPKNAQFAQIDAKGRKIVVNSCSWGGNCPPKSE